MVGYNEKDSLTTEQKLFAGCVSGCLTRIATQPLDFLKLKAQITKPPKPGEYKKNRRNIELFKETRRILKKDGPATFFRGHNLGQVHSILSASTQFYIYELLTKYHAKNIESYKAFSQFICATIAGCFATALVMPIEVIRVRQMLVKDQYTGIIRGGLKVYKYGGFFAFYEGLTASLLQMGPAVGISFTVFKHTQEMTLNLLRHYDGTSEAAMYDDKTENVVLSSTVAGCVSGLISKTVTYPFDLTKRRMQISSHHNKKEGKGKDLIKCKHVFSCIKQTIKKDGFLGLFRGLKVTVYKAQVTNIVAFTTYEWVCHMMR